MSVKSVVTSPYFCAYLALSSLFPPPPKQVLKLLGCVYPGTTLQRARGVGVSKYFCEPEKVKQGKLSVFCSKCLKYFCRPLSEYGLTSVNALGEFERCVCVFHRNIRRCLLVSKGEQLKMILEKKLRWQGIDTRFGLLSRDTSFVPRDGRAWSRDRQKSFPTGEVFVF